jgi:hypothetical protein
MKLLSLVFITLLICGCKKKQVNKLAKDQQSKANLPRKLSVDKIGELRFRKSYALNETIPSYYYAQNADSLLLKRFKALGYLNNNYHILTKKLTTFNLFDIEKPDTAFALTDDLNNKISCQIKKTDSSYMYDLLVFGNAEGILIHVKNKFILPGLQFSTVDIIPGGFKEIILLDEYYIINGDNFDFFIYEIKYN